MIYLDNNANTMMPQEGIDALVSFLNVGNPSGHYAGKCRKLMEVFKNEIAHALKFSLDEYEIIFNSGASESNNHIIHSVVRSYRNIKKEIPHIVISGTEHKSMKDCVKGLADCGALTYTELPINMRSISTDELNTAIRPNTALVAIMGASNETGIVNDLKQLRAIANTHGVPFYSDTVQLIGKLEFNVQDTAVDAFCMSFHKLHGPIGCGVLVIRKSLLQGYQICAHICGAQNNALRGGTENIAGIAGSLIGFRYSMKELRKHIQTMARLRAIILSGINKKYTTSYLDDNNEIENSITYIAPKNFNGTLPNTILLEVCRANICNKAIRNGLEAHGIIVGLGSACSQDSTETTPLTSKLKCPDGVIRISVSFENTEKEVMKFVEVFLSLIASDSVLKANTPT